MQFKWFGQKWSYTGENCRYFYLSVDAAGGRWWRFGGKISLMEEWLGWLDEIVGGKMSLTSMVQNASAHVTEFYIRGKNPFCRFTGWTAAKGGGAAADQDRVYWDETHGIRVFSSGVGKCGAHLCNSPQTIHVTTQLALISE